MPNYGYVEHQIHEVAGFKIVDATSTGPRPHDDLIWVGVGGGMDGRWMSPQHAMELVGAIANAAFGNVQRRRLAELEKTRAAESDPQASELEPLEPLTFDGLAMTRLTLLNPVGQFVSDPAFTMKWLQTVADVKLESECEQVASCMALEEAAKGVELTLMGVINLWRPVPELRHFAESLYAAAMPGPFGPFQFDPVRTS